MRRAALEVSPWHSTVCSGEASGRGQLALRTKSQEQLTHVKTEGREAFLAEGTASIKGL